MDEPTHLSLSTAPKRRRRQGDAPKVLLRGDQPPNGAVGITLPGQWIDGRGPYEIDVDLALVDGVFDCVGLTVRSAGAAQRVDWQIMRDVSIPELIRAGVAFIDASGLGEMTARSLENRGKPGGLYDELDEAGRRWYDQLPHAKQTREDAAQWRRRVRDAIKVGGRERLEVIAVIYNREVRRGSRKPVQAIERELGITNGAAVRAVARCRDQGLIPPTTKGRVTPRKETE